MPAEAELVQVKMQELILTQMMRQILRELTK